MLRHARRQLLKRTEVDDEIVFYGEDGVGGEPGIVFGVDLGYDGFVVVVCDLDETSKSAFVRCRAYWFCRLGWVGLPSSECVPVSSDVCLMLAGAGRMGRLLGGSMQLVGGSRDDIRRSRLS